MYIDDIEGVEPIPFTFFEYGSLSFEFLELWLKKNKTTLKFEAKNEDLVHKCGGKIQLWVMNKYHAW